VLTQLRSQVTLNALPPLLSELGVASVAPEDVIIVISSSVNEEIEPVVEPSVVLAPEKLTLWKSVSGSTPDEPLGASAIHSALLSAAPA
jgi:hypothetical protein